MLNPVIIVAIIVQWIVARFSRIAGAIIGFVITTGIVLWGLAVYADGGEIALFGVTVSQGIFLIACLVWYGFDTWEFIAARKETVQKREVLESPLVQDPSVQLFYQTTRSAWAAGSLSKLGGAFAQEGKMPLEKLIHKYPPFEGSALRAFFDGFQPLENEFLVGLGNAQSGNSRGWFTLTNRRLIQRDGRTDQFREVILADVGTYQFKGAMTKTLRFQMKSGEEIAFEKVQMYPTDKYLSGVMSMQT